MGASKTLEPPLSWEPSTLTPPDNPTTVCSPAIQATPHPTMITITPSSPSNQMGTPTFTNSQTNSNLLIPSWSVPLNANPTGEPVESATVCNASETQESTADAWETLAVHLSSSTQMMVSPTWSETPLSVPQTAPSTPQESGPRTSSSRTGSRESSLPNLFLVVAIIYRNVMFYFNKKNFQKKKKKKKKKKKS